LQIKTNGCISLAVIFLFSYRLLSLRGCVKSDYEGENLVDIINDIASINNIEYYDNPLKDISETDIEYVVILNLESGNYIGFANELEILSIKAISLASPSIKLKKINPIPLIILPIGIVVILVIPMKRG
jgi:hypothetical protein